MCQMKLFIGPVNIQDILVIMNGFHGGVCMRLVSISIIAIIVNFWAGRGVRCRLIRRVMFIDELSIFDISVMTLINGIIL